jgi:glycosyltransferase involved in cell wall biosynthesis
MIGGGRRFDDLARTVKERGLDASFRFVAYQERAMLTYSLGVPDVHWLSLNPSLEGLIVPSKFYGIAAAGKPIIVIGANDGELARLVRKHECGIVIAPGDGVALAATVSRLANNPASVAELGAQARRMLEMHFTRQQAFERWHRLLEALDQQLEPPA